MDNCWISGQVIADMKKVYNDLIIINLYVSQRAIVSYCQLYEISAMGQ